MPPLFPVTEQRFGGTFGYATGTTGTGTVDVPAQARLLSVYLVAGGTAATATIAGGATITVPANTQFAIEIPGNAKNSDVVIGGTPASYVITYFT